MPEKVERCVRHLMADPKFKPRKAGQSKRSAAWAVCTTQIMGTSAKKRASNVEKTWRSSKK